MSILEKTPQIEHILKEIDRLIAEMSFIRSQVAALGESPTQAGQSIRQAEFFGMWADREDMQGQSSREWREKLWKI